MGNIVYYLSLVLRFYVTMMLIYIIMSWVPESRQTQLGRVLASFVEPYLSIFRKIIPPIGDVYKRQTLFLVHLLWMKKVRYKTQ